MLNNAEEAWYILGTLKYLEKPKQFEFLKEYLDNLVVDAIDIWENEPKEDLTDDSELRERIENVVVQRYIS